MPAIRSIAGAYLLLFASPVFGEQTSGGEAVAITFGKELATLNPEHMSGEVERRTLATVLDVLGTLTYTVRRHGNDPYIVRVREIGGAAETRIPGLGICAPMESAAGALAYLIHGAETDDSDFRAELRASPVIMGPSLAAAGSMDSSGQEFLLAAAAGYTLMGRVAAPFGALQPRGWMSAGVWGPGGGAASVARLMKLGPDRSGQAIALGAAAANGPFQYFYDQTEVKRLVVARAAVGAAQGARLAAAGEHGSPHIYEGTAGLFKLMDPQVSVDEKALTADFERLEGPLYLYPKFYSASSSILPTLEGFAKLQQKGKLPPDGISSVVLREQITRGQVLAKKLRTFEQPQTIIGAKINYAFMVALFLKTGSAGPDAVTQETLADPDIIRLARNVTYEPIPDSDAATIVVRYTDGHEVVVDPVIIDYSKIAPFEADLRRRKFDLLTESIGPDGRRELRRLVEELPRTKSMRHWLREVDRVIAPAPVMALPCDATAQLTSDMRDNSRGTLP